MSDRHLRRFFGFFVLYIVVGIDSQYYITYLTFVSMNRLLLFATFACCSIAHELKYAIGNVKIPLHINVWLIGDDTSEYVKLEETLNELFPVHNPIDGIGVEFNHEYHVNFGGLSLLETYKKLIIDETVDTEAVLKLISSLQTTIASDMKFLPSHNNLPIVIVLPNSLLPSHSVQFSSSYYCSQTVVDDVLFVDLSANSCDLSNVIGKENAFGASGFTSNVFGTLFASKSGEKSISLKAEMYTLSRISSIVISAARKFSVGNALQYLPAYSAQRVLVPIVFLRSGSSSGQPKTFLGDEQTSAIQLWLQNILLPSQSAVILTANHFVEDHPQLSIALASASRWYAAKSEEDDKIHIKVPYLDSAQLLTELAQIGDNLCRRLLVDGGHGYVDDTLLEVEAFFQALADGEEKGPSSLSYTQYDRYGIGDDMYYHRHMRRASGETIIAPVFVLSDILLGKRDSDEDDDGMVSSPIHPLFDMEHHVVSRRGMTMVMHTSRVDVSVHKPASGGWHQLEISDVAKSIAEGLATNVAGLRPLHQDGRGGVDLTWADGSHPFAPFGRIHTRPLAASIAKTHISSVISWTSRRGIAISRGMTAISKLLNIGDRASSFVLEFSRPLSLLLPPSRRESNRSRDKAPLVPYRLDVSVEDNTDLIVQYIMYPVAFVDELATSESMPSEIVSVVADQRELVRALVMQIADIKQFLEEGASLLSASHVSTAENNVEVLEARFLEMERRIKETMDRCQFASEGDGSGMSSGKHSDQSFKNIVAVVCVILLMGGIYGMKKFQEMIEKREKKNM